jgi:methylase of polypeptide subunit release factors
VDFILDRTMEPALQQFGLDGFRIIDLACGSGHFLIAAFERLFDKWQKRLPPMDPIDCASRALASVYGVDLNPFAIAIARFRLLIAALRKCEVTQLSEAPNFQTNLAVEDSLLHGMRPRDAGRGVQSHAFDTSGDFYYATEDAPKLRLYLSQQYHAVVANPPYITVADSMLREQYRDRFGSASGGFQLGVPFTERCFDLAEYGDKPGSVGMITSNAFMKRSFGRILIEQYFAELGYHPRNRHLGLIHPRTCYSYVDSIRSEPQSLSGTGSRSTRYSRGTPRTN